MDAWELLVLYSSAPAGSDVWEHLNALSQGEASYGFILEATSDTVILTADAEIATSSNVNTVVLSADIVTQVISVDSEFNLSANIQELILTTEVSDGYSQNCVG